MIDIVALREDKTPVLDSLKRRGREKDSVLLDEVLVLDAQWREAKGSLDGLRRERNVASQNINKAKKAGKDAQEAILEAKRLSQAVSEQEVFVEELFSKREKLLLALPNTLADEVPSGASEEENVERAVFGEPIVHDFEVKNHAELLEDLGLVDFDASRRTSGNGFFFLKGSLALLDQALQQYAIDVMLKHGFELIKPPYMLREEIIRGVIDADHFAESIFSIKDQDLHLIGTSELSLLGMLTDTEIDVRNAPIKLVGVSPCFRQEIGSHGIDEKGLFRTHQFEKIEQIVVCSPEESYAWFDKLLEMTTEIFTSLGIPIRHLEMCTGDLGMLKHRQFDIEAWSPRRKEYFEVVSCSNLTDAQARRLNIRLVQPDGTRVVAHTLNNTAIATSRAMVAIVENFQNKDGTVDIPQVLHPYMRGVTKFEKK
ncbi:MAG: serine--tRNA ligase [Candidatus Woesearchaeota archaeon]